MLRASLALALFLAGFAIAPGLIAALTLVQQTVPAARLTEGMAFVHTGLAAGLALACPEAAIVGAEPSGWDDMARSIAAGTIVPVEPDAPPTLCDALKTPRVSPITFDILRARAATIHAVSDDEVVAAMRWARNELRLTVEPGGAAALAAVLAGKADLPAGSDPAVERAVQLGSLDLIRLIAPTTRAERMAAAVEGAQGFVYLVARLGVTGASRSLAADLAESVERLRGATRLAGDIRRAQSSQAHDRSRGSLRQPASRDRGCRGRGARS